MLENGELVERVTQERLITRDGGSPMGHLSAPIRQPRSNPRFGWRPHDTERGCFQPGNWYRTGKGVTTKGWGFFSLSLSLPDEKDAMVRELLLQSGVVTRRAIRRWPFPYHRRGLAVL